MNNFDPIAFGHDCGRPLVAAHDSLVQLDSDAFGGQRQLFHQLAQFQFMSKLADFTIDLNLQ